VSAATSFPVQYNKAIVGRNAFAHEAGIHQDGMLKERSTYEIMRPEDVGFQATDLVLGKHSGRAALADRAKSLGYQLTGEQLQTVFEEFKKLADKKKEVYDGDIIALIEHQILGKATEEEWTLVSFEGTSGTGRKPHVRVTLRRGDKEFTEEMSDGDGLIDCAFLATEKITGIKLKCIDYRVRSASLGHDALGEVNLLVEHNGQQYRGRGVSTDTVEATVHAILVAANRVVVQGDHTAQRLNPQHTYDSRRTGCLACPEWREEPATTRRLAQLSTVSLRRSVFSPIRSGQAV
jgi:2-isopropylmalate synthase